MECCFSSRNRFRLLASTSESFSEASFRAKEKIVIRACWTFSGKAGLGHAPITRDSFQKNHGFVE
jgi:hypothetical protein